MSISSTAAAAPDPAPVVVTRAARRRLDPVELGLLAILAALSMWVLTTDIIQAAQHHLTWTRTDGFFIVDQMQYLAWIQSSAQHWLISNLYVLRASPADYLQPAILISAGVVKLGIAPWLALLLWKPVAVVAFFLAARAVVHRVLDRQIDRRAALALALLFGSLSVVYGSLGIVGDMMATWSSWGYPFGLIAVALIVFALLRYDRARLAGRVAWTPGLLGALAASLHPWQGELLILIVAGCELVRAPETLHARRAGHHPGPMPALGRRLADRRLALALLTIALTLAPLVYYLVLGRLDINWEMARDNSKHSFPFLSIALAGAPLAVFAALGYRGRPASFLELALRMWTPAALVIYVLSATALSATPLHAFDGITIPLAVLAVSGIRAAGLNRLPRAGALAWSAVLLGTVPANVYAMAYAHVYTGPTFKNGNYIRADERRAIQYLADDRDSGGVLTQFYLGALVPAYTGRQVFAGDCLWTEPLCIPRSLAADALLQGQLSPVAARRFVRQTGARFVLASCYPHVALERWLGSMVVTTRRFGCAAVWELAPPGRPTGPFAATASRRRV